MRSRKPYCGYCRLVLIAASAFGRAGEDMQLACCFGIRNFIILVCTIFLFLFAHTHVELFFMLKNSNLCYRPLQLLCWVLITVQILSIFDQISETLAYPLCQANKQCAYANRCYHNITCYLHFEILHFEFGQIISNLCITSFGLYFLIVGNFDQVRFWFDISSLQRIRDVILR